MTEITHRSDFSLSSTEIYPGQFIVMSVTNVEDTAEILFSSKARTTYEANVTPDSAIAKLYEFTPVFVKDGSLARAILPFPHGLSEGVFTFSLSHGAAKQVFSVNILSAPEEKSYEIDKDSSLLSSIISNSSLASFAAIMKGISPPANDSVLFRKEFLLPSSFGLSSGYSFGDKVTSKDGSASFIAKGNEYTSDSPGGEAICALNAGTVVAIGNCDYLGSYVVLDHGLGLRTWYCHLSSVDVDKGDILAKGEQLGKCGTGGLLSTRGVLILCSVYDTLIDPDFILGKEIKY
jgi:murein DD-endopeptidase MepM/ murein hydrolase activator NlpD